MTRNSSCDVILGTSIAFNMANSANGEKRGGRYCVAGALNLQRRQNSNKTPGTRMHQFPTNPSVRAKWAQIGVRHRHDFQEPVSKYASLCSHISMNHVMKEEIRLFLVWQH